MADEQVVTPTPEEGADKTKENEVVEQVDDKDLKSALAQKEHFREKAEKLEKEREELLAKVEFAKQKEEPKPQVETNNQDLDSLKEDLAKIKFSQKHLDIDAGDIEEIFRLASMNNQTPDEVLEKNEMVKIYLDKKTKDKKISNAIPDNNRAGIPKQEKPVSEMTREEHMEWVKSFDNQ